MRLLGWSPSFLGHHVQFYSKREYCTRFLSFDRLQSAHHAIVSECKAASQLQNRPGKTSLQSNQGHFNDWFKCSPLWFEHVLFNPTLSAKLELHLLGVFQVLVLYYLLWNGKRLLPDASNALLHRSLD